MNFAAPPTDYETFLTNSLEDFPIKTRQSSLLTKETPECIFPIHGTALDNTELRNFTLSISTTSSKQSFHNLEFKLNSDKCNTETANDHARRTVQEMNREYQNICCNFNKTSFTELLQDSIQNSDKIRRLKHDESKSIPQIDKDSHTILCEDNCNTISSSILPSSIPENPNSNDKMLENNSKVEIVTPQMKVADPLADLEETPTSSSISSPPIPEKPNINDKMLANNSEREIVTPQSQPVVADQLKDLEETSTEKMNKLDCDIYYDDMHYQFEPSKTPSYDVVDPRSMETIFQQREQPIQVPSDSDKTSDELCYDFINHSMTFESKSIVSVKSELFITCQVPTNNSNLTNNDEELFVSNFTTQHSRLQYNVITKPSLTCNFDRQDEKNCNLTNTNEDLFVRNFTTQQSRLQYNVVTKPLLTCSLAEQDEMKMLLPSPYHVGIDEDVPCRTIQSLQPNPQILAENINAKLKTFSSDQSTLFIKWLQSPIRNRTKQPLPLSNQPSNSLLSLPSIPEEMKLPLDKPNNDIFVNNKSDTISPSVSMLSTTESNVESELLSDLDTVSDNPSLSETKSTVVSYKPVKAITENDEACVQPLKEKTCEDLSLPENPIPLQGQQTLPKMPVKEKTWIEKLHEERYRFGSYPFTPLKWKTEASKLNDSTKTTSIHIKTPRRKKRFRKHGLLHQLRKKISMEEKKSKTQPPYSSRKKELPPFVPIKRFGFLQVNPNVREPVFRQSVIKTNQPKQIKPPNEIKLPPKVDITLPLKLKQEKVPVRKPKFNERRPNLKDKNVNSNVGIKKVKMPRVKFNLPLIKEERINKQRLDDKKWKRNVGLKGKQRNLKPKPPPLNKGSKTKINVKDKKKLLEEAKLANILKLNELNQRKQILMESIKQQKMKKLAARLSFDEIQHQDLTIDEKLFMIKNVYLCKREDIAQVHHRYLDMKFRIDELNEKMSYLDVKKHKKRFNEALKSVQAKQEGLKQMRSDRSYEIERRDQQLEGTKDRMLLRSEALQKNLEYKELSALQTFEDFKEKAKILQDTREMVHSLWEANSAANADR